MKRIILILTAVVGLSIGFMANARADVAQAAIDTPWVAVGMPRVLHLEVTVPSGTQVQWPASVTANGIAARDYEDPTKTYMLEFGPDTNFDIDTVPQTGGMITLQQNLQFFAFDSAAMVIAPFKFVANGRDTIATEMLALKCEHPFEQIPDDPQTMQDLKGILSPEFVLWDYVWWMLWVLLAVVLAIAAWFGYKYYKAHSSAASEIVVKEKPLPAHVTALQALETLAEKKLWQAGHFKQFHTELSEILRRYIEDRYHVAAMESTTDEIMQELVELTMTQRSSYNNLREVLQMADLVKFAKFEPLPDENQMVLMNARLFVEQTKEVVADDVESKEEEPQQ